MVNVAETFGKYSDKPYSPSGLLDYRTEPLMLMKTGKDRKQANIQGIHCIIKTATGNRRWGLSEFFLFFFQKLFSFAHFQSFTFWPVSRTSISFQSSYTPPTITICTTHTLNLLFPCISTSHTSDHSVNIQNTCTSTTSTHDVHCLAYTQAKDDSLVLWYSFLVDFEGLLAVV